MGALLFWGGDYMEGRILNPLLPSLPNSPHLPPTPEYQGHVIHMPYSFLCCQFTPVAPSYAENFKVLKCAILSLEPLWEKTSPKPYELNITPWVMAWGGSPSGVPTVPSNPPPQYLGPYKQCGTEDGNKNTRIKNP